MPGPGIEDAALDEKLQYSAIAKMCQSIEGQF